jgi:Cytotoxic translational repressor of toxin-antitoxin stability system
MNGEATQIASRQFDEDFFKLPTKIRERVQVKLDTMGLQLEEFPHYRMTNSDKYRLRVGDYRIIYRFDLSKGEIYLVAIGHRREIYRD